MAKLTKLLETEKCIMLSGPYGTEVAERVARDIVEKPQKASGVPHNKFIGAACSALLTEQGQVYLREVASDYLGSVSKDQALILVTPSFRLAKQTLEAASSIRGFDPNLPNTGLELCLDSINLCADSINASGRARGNTLLAMSLGPPFDCYRGEDTPPDVDNKYLPQTFVAIRFGHALDYLMFETVPSLEAAIGAARAHKKAQDELIVPERLEFFQRLGTIDYFWQTLEKVIKIAGEDSVKLLCPTYNPKTKTFTVIESEKDYVISLCLEHDGTLNGIPLDEAITQLYATIESQKLYQPVGMGINCNAPAVTEEALSSLSTENFQRVIGVHPNASLERDPRKYGQMTRAQRIEIDDYTAIIKRLVEGFNIPIVGGCCGTNKKTTKAMYEALSL